MILLRQDDIHRTRGMFLNLPHISDTSGDYMSCYLLGLICSHYFILSRYIDEIGLSDFLAYLQHLKVPLIVVIQSCLDSSKSLQSAFGFLSLAAPFGISYLCDCNVLLGSDARPPGACRSDCISTLQKLGIG